MIGVIALVALAATSAPTSRDLIELIDLAAPAVSPDGGVVAIESRRAHIERNTVSIRWHLLPLDTGRRALSPVRVIDAGDGGEPISRVSRRQIIGYSIPQVPQWSPDSQWFAYRVQRKGAIELWRSHRDGRPQQQLTHRGLDVQTFCWSRDGTKLLFATRPTKAAFDKALEEEGARGYLYDERFAPYYSNAPLFDPDAAPRTVWAHDLATGTDRLASAGEIEELEYSQREVDTDLRRVRTTGINSPLSVKDCTAPECTGYFQGIWRSDDRQQFYFLRWVNGRNYGALALYRWRIGSPTVTRLLETDDFLDGCVPSGPDAKGGQLICAHESATTPRKLVTLELATGRLQTLHDPNPGFQPLPSGAVTPLTWRDRQGNEGFGHVVKPAGYRPDRKYPLIIVQYRSRGFLRGGIGDEYPIPLFSAAGYAVLSFHRPKLWDLEVTAASHEDLERLGFEELRDRRRVLSVLEAGIDQLVAAGLIDRDKVGITGLSDGGETVGFALIHAPSRFAAAAASWTFWNPITYDLAGPGFGQRLQFWGVPSPDTPISGAPVEQARASAAFWRSVSVSLNAEYIRTPLLLQVADHELLAETATVRALKAHHRPVELYVFPDEFHIKSQPLHRYHLYRRNLQWFDFWLRGLEHPDPLDAGQYARWRRLREDSKTAPMLPPSHTPAMEKSVQPAVADPPADDARPPPD